MSAVNATDAQLTTAEAARRLGVSCSTLKRWSDGGIVASSRTAGGHRRFSIHTIDRFRSHQRSNADPEAESTVERWARLLLEHHDTLVVSAELLRARSRLGAWWAVAQEVGTALDELGARGARGQVSVLEGQAAAELLGRSLAWCSETIPVSPSAPSGLLVTAEGDDHTLGLSLVELVCREAGWNTRWAGRRAPRGDVEARIAGRAVQMVLVSASSASTDEALLREQVEAYARAARAAGVELVLGGRGRWPRELTHGVRLDSFEELSRHLNELRNRNS